MRLTPSLLLLTLTFLGPLHPAARAQEPLPEGFIRLEFQAISWQRTDGSKIFYQTNEGAVALKDLSHRKRSGSYTYTGPRTLAFFEEEIGADDLPLRTPLGAVTIPAGLRSALLLFIPTGSPETPFIIRAFDDSRESFPMGSFKFYNISRVQLGCKADEHVFILQPGQNETVTADNITEGVLGLHVKARGEDGWESIQNTVFNYRPTARVMVFITDESHQKSRRLEFKTFVENESQLTRRKIPTDEAESNP